MDAFAALADPVRRALLVRAAASPSSVSDLVRDHAISRPAISRHLRVLREAGLVRVTRAGRQRLHELDREGLAPVRQFLQDLEAPTPPIAEHRLDALDLEVRRTVHERRRQDPEPGTSKETG